VHWLELGDLFAVGWNVSVYICKRFITNVFHGLLILDMKLLVMKLLFY